MEQKIDVLFIEERLTDKLTEKFGPEEFSDCLDIKVAFSIKEALAWLGKDHFDIAVLDMELQDPESLKTILSILLNVKDLPILVVTESTQLKFLFERMNLGTEFYVAKSKFDATNFHEKVSFLIETYKVANTDLHLFKNNFLL
jgi:DNA-binding NarL/FixJ family response regulator